MMIPQLRQLRLSQPSSRRVQRKQLSKWWPTK
jgi:hypothetical protein